MLNTIKKMAWIFIIRLKLVAYLGSNDSFSVLVLRKVRENSWKLSTFSLLLEKPIYKNPRRFLYRFEHAKLVLILKCYTVPCRIFRGISFLNVVIALLTTSVLWQKGKNALQIWMPCWEPFRTLWRISSPFFGRIKRLVYALINVPGAVHY